MSRTRGELQEIIAGGIFSSKSITFDGATGNGSVEASATLSTNLTGANNDLTFTAVTSGAAANSITIRYVDPAAAGAALSVSVSGNAITVNLATDGSSVITSTAAEIDAAIDALPAAAALVTPANKAANDGSGVVTAMSATALAGGTDAQVPLFTVTGPVAVRLLAVCSTNLAGASATLAAGTVATTGGLIAQSTATDIDANEIWHDATPDASIELSSVLTEKIVTDDIILTVGTAAITSGAMDFVLSWRPLSDNAEVIPA